MNRTQMTQIERIRQMPDTVNTDFFRINNSFGILFVNYSK